MKQFLFICPCSHHWAEQSLEVRSITGIDGVTTYYSFCPVCGERVSSPEIIEVEKRPSGFKPSVRNCNVEIDVVDETEKAYKVIVGDNGRHGRSFNYLYKWVPKSMTIAKNDKVFAPSFLMI